LKNFQLHPFKRFIDLKKNIRGNGLHIILALLALIMTLPGASFAANDTLGVKAYGSAVNSGNSGATRKIALEAAIRDAVGTAVGQYLASHGIEADEQALAAGIYSQAASFVLNYKILSERWITETPELPAELSTEGDDRGSASPAAGAQATPEKPKKAAPQTYNVLIDATLDMGAIKKAVMRVLGAEHSADLKLVLLDISDYETFLAIKKSLKKVTVIESITFDSFSRDRFVATARTVMDPATLAEEIGREAGSDFVVTAYGMDTIIIKAFPGPGAPIPAH